MRVHALVIAACCSTCESSDCVEGAALWTDPPAGAYAVCGDLIVTGRRSEEMEVLRRLEVVEGSLVVEANPELTEIPELPTLELIGGSLSISDNPELSRIHGFPALVTVGGGLYVGENPALTSLKLGDALTSVHSLFLALNPSMREFRSQLLAVEDDLTVANNSSLEVLEMPGLIEVPRNFYITANLALQELEFPALRGVGGAWYITDNASLQALTGFPALEHAAVIEVSGNADLRELTFAGSFTESISLLVYDNARLERLAGSPEVRLADDTDVYVGSNPALKAVDGFAAVIHLDRLAVDDNAQLAEIAGFTALTRVSSLEIIDNAVLTGPSGWFPELKNAERVSIYRNPSLPPSHVDELLNHLTVEQIPRIGDNMGEDTALDPCPWPSDSVCDALEPNGEGTGLCATDPEGCGV